MNQFFENSTLGSTPEGKAWCIKTLHPSSEQPDFKGIPGGSDTPVVLCNYMKSFTIPAPDATKTWNCDIIMAPHILTQFCYTAATADLVTTTGSAVYNDQLSTTVTTDTIASVINGFADVAESIRPVYISLTCIYDAPALANQGTVSAAQYTIGRMKVNPRGAVSDVNRLWRPLNMFNYSDVADFDNLQNMPQAYFGAAKDGCYMPLKLDQRTREWVRTEDSVVYGCYPLEEFPIASNTTDMSSFDVSTVKVLPFTCGYAPYYNSTTSIWSEGTASYKMASDQFGHIAWKNIPGQANLTLTYRAAWELRVRPETELTPFQKLPPVPDHVACDSHDLIARNLKDAFPEAYNQNDTLKRVISTIARGIKNYVSPMIRVINPTLGGITNRAANQALQMIDNKPQPPTKLLIQRRNRRKMVKQNPIKLNINRRQRNVTSSNQ